MSNMDRGKERPDPVCHTRVWPLSRWHWGPLKGFRQEDGVTRQAFQRLAAVGWMVWEYVRRLLGREEPEAECGASGGLQASFASTPS